MRVEHEVKVGKSAPLRESPDRQLTVNGRGKALPNNAFLNPTPEKVAPDIVALAKVLSATIPEDKRRVDAYRVLAYLAEETSKQSPGGALPVKIATKTIHLDLGGNPNREPAAWLSPIWNRLCDQVMPSLEPVLIEHCRQAGLSHFVTVRKAEGNPTYYYLEPKPLPPSGDRGDAGSAAEELPAGVLRYEPDITLKLSRLGRLFFVHELKWTDGKRWSFLSWHLLMLLFAVVVGAVLFLALLGSTKPLSGGDLVLLMVMVAIPWGTYRQLESSFRLFDDRIALASDWLLAWKEQGATMEIVRAHDDNPSTILVRRYTAKCPICGAMVKLDQGEPDFPRRLVGRCAESPREHLYSFDRVTRQGVLLRDDPRGVPQKI